MHMHNSIDDKFIDVLPTSFNHNGHRKSNDFRFCSEMIIYSVRKLIREV